jgi:hypothetical protein
MGANRQRLPNSPGYNLVSASRLSYTCRPSMNQK